MNFKEDLDNLISRYQNSLIEKVSKKFNISRDELKEIILGNDENPQNILTCTHIFKRGKNTGRTCNSKIESGTLCKKHKKKPILVMRKYKFFPDLFLHGETGFLVRDKKEGVIGKIYEQEQEHSIIPLSDEDKKICKEWRLIVADTTILKKYLDNKN